MASRTPLSLAALLSLTACSFDFERSSEVIDRRILAIQVEPPELVGGSEAPSSVRARALVVDPREPAAVAEFTWWSCLTPPRADTDFGFGFGGGDGSRCPENEATVQHASTSGELPSIVQDIALPEPVVGTLAAASEVPAPQLKLQLRVASGTEELFAVKEVAVTGRLPEGQEPNRNPALTGLTLDGESWLPDTPRTLKLGECPTDDTDEVEAEDGTRQETCTHDIEPLFEETASQFYKARGLTGTIETQRERLRFSWFTDGGSFRRDTTLQFDPRDPSPDNVGPQAVWRQPPGKTGRFTLWVVVRDGRGGTHWEKRELILE